MRAHSCGSCGMTEHLPGRHVCMCTRDRTPSPIQGEGKVAPDGHDRGSNGSADPRRHWQ